MRCIMIVCFYLLYDLNLRLTCYLLFDSGVLTKTDLEMFIVSTGAKRDMTFIQFGAFCELLDKMANRSANNTIDVETAQPVEANNCNKGSENGCSSNGNMISDCISQVRDEEEESAWLIFNDLKDAKTGTTHFALYINVLCNFTSVSVGLVPVSAFLQWEELAVLLDTNALSRSDLRAALDKANLPDDDCQMGFEQVSILQ